MFVMRWLLSVALGLLSVSVFAEDHAWRELTHEDLEGCSSDDIYWFVARCTMQDRFDELEVLFAYARANPIVDGNGGPVLWTLYDSVMDLYKSAVPSVQTRVHEKYLAWLKSKPNSPTPRLIFMLIEYHKAWKVRGSGFSNTVSAENMREFSQIIAQLSKAIETNREVLAGDIRFHDLDIDVKKCNSAKYSEILKCVDRAHALHPKFRSVFYSAAHAALPRWSGSDRLILDLAEHVYAISRDDVGLAYYFYVASQVAFYEGSREVVEAFKLEPADIFKGARDYCEYFPDQSHWARNVAAKFACELDDREEARAFFDEIEDDWSEIVWPRAKFDVWKAWANGEDVGFEQTRLHTFVDLGAKSRVVAALEGGTNPNVVNEDGYSPIFLAAHNKDWDIVRALLDHGADPNMGFGNLGTPLSIALRNDELELADLLLDKEASPRGTRYKDHMPILICMRREHFELLKRIITHPDMIIDQEYVSRFTPLNLAISEKRRAAARILIDHGANLNARTYFGYSPLVTTQANGFDELFAYMLEKGADPRYATLYDWTPLHIAVNQGNEVQTEALLGSPLIDVNVLNELKQTPLHIAAMDGIPGVMKLLVTHPDIDLDYAHRDDGFTALHYATRKSSIGCVRALVDAGADATLKTKDGQTAGDIAREIGRSRLVKIIDGE